MTTLTIEPGKWYATRGGDFALVGGVDWNSPGLHWGVVVHGGGGLITRSHCAWRKPGDSVSTLLVAFTFDLVRESTPAEVAALQAGRWPDGSTAASGEISQSSKE